MRKVRLVAPIATAIAVLIPAAAGGSVTAHPRNPCAVPHGWKISTRDSDAVVIQRHGTYKYCSRTARAGHFKAVARVGAESVSGLRLRGHYIAFYDGALVLQDAQTGTFHSFIAEIPPGVSAPVLSADGVAAWIATGASWPSPKDAATVLAVLTSRGPADNGVLDYGPPQSTTLAGLQLYNCAAGCPPNTVVVAWTNNGQQHYAQVQGGG